MRVRQALLILILGISAYAQSDRSTIPSQCTSTATGDIEIRDFHSAVFHNDRKLRVLLPQGYRDDKNAHTKYPVLYLNDGANMFDVCTAFRPKEWKVDETAISLIAEGKVEPLIIVGVDSARPHTKESVVEERRVGSRPNEY